MLKVIFIGTRGDFTLRPLQAVLAAHAVVALVESAPRDLAEATRSRAEDFAAALAHRLGRPSLRSLAHQHRIPYLRLTARNVSDLRTLCARLRPDAGCIASMHRLLPADCAALPRHGFLNFHPSLLPKLRGPNVWFWHYHEMETLGGATVFRVDEGEDTGDILRQESFPLPLGLPAPELERISIELGARLLVEALNDLEAGRSTARPQRHLPCPVRARYLTDAEELFEWRDWTLPRTFHFLRGTEASYRAFTPAQGWLGHLEWRATGFEAAVIPAAGRIHIDGRGVYFAHPAGRIRLRPRGRLVLRAALLLLLLAAAIAVVRR